MTAIPPWVVASPQQCHDVHWLAYWWTNQRGDARAAGIGATLGWVLGEDVGPITRRDEQPVTLVLAQAEQGAAIAVETGLAYPLAAEYARLDVVPVAPVDVDPQRALGVWQTLRWLRGVEVSSPLPMPVRDLQGRVMTADELFDAAIAVTPHCFELPEQRVKLRTSVDRLARRSAQLVSMISQAQHQLTASTSCS